MYFSKKAIGILVFAAALLIMKGYVLDFLPDAVRGVIGAQVEKAKVYMGKISDIPYIVYRFRGHTLPVYNIAIDQKKLKELDEYFYSTKDDPSRVKEFKKAVFTGDDGKTYEAKVTYRGDGDIHFLYPKKSWRIEFNEDALFQNIRSIDLIIPEDRIFLVEQFNNERAKKLGIFAPESKFVFLKVNGSEIGVYLAIEHWGKEMVEKEIMSSDTRLYGEKGFGSEFLYNDIAKWQTYLKEPKDKTPDRSDLNQILTLLNQPSDERFFTKIGDILDLENFYHWNVQNVLSGTSPDDFHNMRIYFNPYIGKFQIIPWDVEIGRLDQNRKIDSTQISQNPLIRRILTNPQFLFERNTALWNYVKDEKNLEDDLRSYDELYNKTRIDFYQDVLKRFSNNDFRREVVKNRGIIEYNFHQLKKMLADTSMTFGLYYGLPPEKNQMGGISVPLVIRYTTESASPVDIKAITITDPLFSEGSVPPHLYEDTNQNGILDYSDEDYGAFQYHADAHAYELVPIKLLRLYSALGERPLRDGTSVFDIVGTPHTFFIASYGSFKLPQDAKVRTTIQNAVTGEMRDQEADFFVDENTFMRFDDISKDINLFIRENPIFTKTSPTSLSLGPGTFSIHHDIIIPRGFVVSIQPGTTLYIGKGVSIVSYSQIVAKGTEQQKIRFLGTDSDDSWGTFAVIGAPGESLFQYTVFQHQVSEPPPTQNPEVHEVIAGPINGMSFRGMLSIFYSDFRIEESEIMYSTGDDGLNAKFAKGLVRETYFHDNSSDALDFDAVDGEISGNRFMQNRNDGIDVSGSRMLIRDNYFDTLGDKGMSIGEKSSVEAFNNVVENSTYGIAVKDSSEATVVNNIFVKNKTGIALYNKKPIFNGGMARVLNTILWGNEKEIDVGAGSSITVSHSVVENGYQGTAVLNQEPIFEDVERGNFRLSSKNSSELLSGGDWGALEKFVSQKIEPVPIGIISY